MQTKHLSVLLDPHKVNPLLSRLCIRFGFCLPPAEIEELSANTRKAIDEFTVAALEAEGYGYTKDIAEWHKGLMVLLPAAMVCGRWR